MMVYLHLNGLFITLLQTNKIYVIVLFSDTQIKFQRPCNTTSRTYKLNFFSSCIFQTVKRTIQDYTYRYSSAVAHVEL